MKLSDIKVGHAVKVDVFGQFRYGIVAGIEEDVKNGKPGIVYTSGRNAFWCYLEQIMDRTA